MIRMRGVTRIYGGGASVRALDGVSLNVEKGGFTAVMGPSGSGKSTLMNILGCMDSAATGEYMLADKNVFLMRADELCAIRNKLIGFVFQSFHLLPRYTAAENVELPMLYAGVPARARKKRAAELLSMVGLTGRESHSPSQLSGGQCQRVAIARALANDPGLILADEPTGNLDTRTGGEIMRMLAELNRSGRTVVLITHSDETAAYAKNVVLLRDGRIYGSD